MGVRENPGVIQFPGSPFELALPFEPAGDQPEAIARLVQGIEDGLSFQTLLGVTGSGKTFTMANVIARLGRPALILAPNKTLAAQLYSEMRSSSPVTRWSTSSRTTTITNRKLTFLRQIPLSKRIPALMMRLSGCATRQPTRY